MQYTFAVFAHNYLLHPLKNQFDLVGAIGKKSQMLVIDSIKVSRGSGQTIADCPLFPMLRDMLQVRGSRKQSQRGSKDSRGGGLRICGQHLARDKGKCRGGAPYGSSTIVTKPPLRELTCAHRDRVRRAPLPDQSAVHDRFPAQRGRRPDDNGLGRRVWFCGGPESRRLLHGVAAAVGRAGRFGASKAENLHTGRWAWARLDLIPSSVLITRDSLA